MTQPIRELPNAKYGENKAYEEQQHIMPAPDAQAMPPAPSPAPQSAPAPEGFTQGEPLPDLGAFSAPSSRPGEPITHGAPLGPGPNQVPGGAGGPLPIASLSQTLAQSVAADSTGVMADLVGLFDRMGL